MDSLTTMSTREGALLIFIFSNIITKCGGNGTSAMNVHILPDNIAEVGTLKDLLNESLTDYDVRIRPRVNQSHAVVANVTFTPLSVVSLDTTDQRLDVLGYFDVSWEDELLRWNASDYGGIKAIQLPLIQVWRPKLVLLKAFHTDNVIGNIKLDNVVVITANDGAKGTVRWVPEGIYSVLCELNVKFYPFDIQDCYLQFYASDELSKNVYLQGDVSGHVSTADYTENAEWKLLEISTGLTEKYGTNILHVDFRLERRAQFTLYTIVLPLLLLSILEVCGFLIPVESGEKISYMVTLFLTFGLFVFILRDGLPHNSLQVSYFLIYVLELSFISVLSVVYAIAETKLFKSQGDKIFPFFNNSVDVTDSEAEKGTCAKAKYAQISHHASGANSTTLTAPHNKRDRINSPGPKTRRRQVDSRNGSTRQSSVGSENDVWVKTWQEFLHMLDLIMFVVFTVLTVLFTLFFFVAVLYR